MPRIPSQKLNNVTSSAGHPYAIASDVNTSVSVPTSSPSSSYSSQSQQHHLNNSYSSTNMSSYPPQPVQHFQDQQQYYHTEDAGSNSNNASPPDSPNPQAQLPNGRSEANQGNQQRRTSQDGMTKMINNGSPSSTEPSRPLPNGNDSPSVPAPSSASGTSTPAKVAGTSAGASGGAASKKKHVCPTCDRAFTTSGHLARHARVHTGERNHKCPFPGCETRCSRQDNLQQHYRIHLSPGSRRSSASATRAAIRGAIASTGSAPSPISAVASDLDAPPPLAQATYSHPHLVHAQPHVQYAAVHQPYPVSPQASPLSQTHVSSPNIHQQPYHHPHTPPITSGTGRVYQNGNGHVLTHGVSRGYSHGQPDSPEERSGPGSATPSADASPVISGPGTGGHSYPAQQQTYIYVQQPGYYQASQHPSPNGQAPASSSTVYSTPPPSSGLDNQYSHAPPISTFYQQHHYPREAYTKQKKYCNT